MEQGWREDGIQERQKTKNSKAEIGLGYMLGLREESEFTEISVLGPVNE